MREERVQKIRTVCLAAVILGISESIVAVVKVEGAWKTALLVSFISCGVYFAGCFGRRQKCFAAALWSAGMIWFLMEEREVLAGSAKSLGNLVIERINTYYRSSFSLWYQREGEQEVQSAFLVLMLVLGMVEVLGFWMKKRRGRALAVVIPVLLQMVILMLGKAVPFWGMFWLILAVLLWKLLPLRREMWKNTAAALGIFVAAAFVAAVPFSVQKLEHYHAVWYPKQLKLEDKFLAFGEKYLNLNRILAGSPRKEQSLSNDKPQQSGEEMFRVTVSSKPLSNIYMKGFVGEYYENGTWSAGSEQEFSDFVQSYGYDPEEYAAYVQNMPWQAAKEYREQTMSFRITGTISGYTLMPYCGQLNENMELLGDGAVKPTGEKNYRVQFSDVPDIFSMKNEEAEEKQWQRYGEYVWEHDLQYPDSGLERLEALAGESSMWFFPEFQYAYTSVAEQVKEILWEDTGYSQELEALPEGEEFTEYFLFEQKKGYCVHYATAGTLLFRMFGIPARYVSGYVVKPSDFTENSDGTYTAVVTDKRAHAWTEIFVEDIGFCPVEVTPAEALPDEEVSQEEVQDQQNSEEMQQPQNEEEQQEAQNDQSQEEQQEVQSNQSQEQQQEVQNGEEQQGNTEKGQGSGEGAGGQENAGNGTEGAKKSAEMRRVRNVILGLLLAAAIAGGIKGAAELRRKYVLERKHERFYQKDHQKGSLALGREIYRILKAMGYGRKRQATDTEYGSWLEQQMPLEGEMTWQEFVTLQQQLIFSKQEISEKQWRELLHLYERVRRRLTHEKGRITGIYWKYIKILS